MRVDIFSAFPKVAPKKAALGKALKLKYLEIYDREHLFLRPDSEFFDELPIL